MFRGYLDYLDKCIEANQLFESVTDKPITVLSIEKIIQLTFSTIAYKNVTDLKSADTPFWNSLCKYDPKVSADGSPKRISVFQNEKQNNKQK